MNSVDEKRTTAQNANAEIKEARVIANYGDPGLDEDYQFDILSRYVIVEIESCDRLLTSDKWGSMIAVVKRPDHLIISSTSLSANPASQERYDYYGNTCKGLAANYSVNGIARINQPYNLGDTIKIRKLRSSYILNSNEQDTLFNSIFPTMPATPNPQRYYNPWHNVGASLPYITNNKATTNLTLKTLNNYSSNYYTISLDKYQYEAFILTINNIDNPTNISTLTQIFQGTWNGIAQVYSANGGYIFQNQESLTIPIIEYEDINIDNRQRVNSNDCLPLIVTTPNSFPTPKVRSIGTINYTPSVAQVNQS